MDTYNSQIVTFQISDHPDTKLVLDTLNQIEEFPEGAILQSDQGSTYTSKEFCKATQQKKRYPKHVSQRNTFI